MKPIKPYDNDFVMTFADSEHEMETADNLLENTPTTDKQVDADFFNDFQDDFDEDDIKTHTPA